MGTLQIHSNNIDELNLLNELAKRLMLKTEIIMPKPETNTEKIQQAIDYEDTAVGIVEGVKRALIEVKEAEDNKKELKTLTELLDENRD
ncbi:MAG: hypothetical protein HN704_09815 [Bacteroidetes bacterium]|jgi:hypothetical protein|nr:hypothetical protein [Bacteroidota bacterium]MBT6686841.1 hypothetical protein [Bacteroidota bacterium]MBT7144170.1 hypothetical protein [Bacteroidota bacterium]MBT7491889.1 hypothetical protein [Bacteroidota bacterium]